MLHSARALDVLTDIRKGFLDWLATTRLNALGTLGLHLEHVSGIPAFVHGALAPPNIPQNLGGIALEGANGFDRFTQFQPGPPHSFDTYQI